MSETDLQERLNSVEKEITAVYNDVHWHSNCGNDCASCKMKLICDYETQILRNMALILNEMLGCQHEYDGIIADRRNKKESSHAA